MVANDKSSTFLDLFRKLVSRLNAVRRRMKKRRVAPSLATTLRSRSAELQTACLGLMAHGGFARARDVFSVGRFEDLLRAVSFGGVLGVDRDQRVATLDLA